MIQRKHLDEVFGLTLPVGVSNQNSSSEARLTVSHPISKSFFGNIYQSLGILPKLLELDLGSSAMEQLIARY